MSTLAENDVLMGSHTSCLVNTPSATRDEQPSDMDLKKKRTIDSDSLSVETTSTYEVSVNSRAIPRLKSVKEEAPTIVVVDPWSTGNTLCKEIVKKGFKLIVVWEKNRVRSQTLPAMETVMCLNFDVAVEQLRQLATKYNIKSVVPGSETGVPLSEKLGNALGYPTNPPRFAEARRNKYLMAETLRAKGVRAVKQTITNDINEAVAFVEQMNPTPFRVIVKPNMGAGSDDVFLCKDMEDFKVKFSIINGKCNSLGLTNDGVLVQEYLTGVEYVIDTVSRNGCHKVASIWAYDKREANGRFNVYYGSFPLVNNSELTNTMIEYIFQVLDALEIRNSPAHAEVKMTETGPCLVEVGSRCHGGGGVWLPMAKRVWGLDQLEMVADDFSCDADKVSTPKPFPTKHLEHGVILDMVSYEDGEITEIPGDDFIKNLPSFSEVTYFCKVGDRLKQSVDCNTVPGSIVLIHPSEEQVVNDYNLIHDLLRQKDGYFKLMRNT